MEREKKRIVVVGGGTGTHTVLRGLRLYADDVDITAIVTMADSGGSTGRLRDEFGQLPIGDVRNALTALAADGEEQDKLMRQLFSYRFNRGNGLSGHSFGNLFLTALTDILGGEEAAIEASSRILRVSGRVVPVTTDNVHLKAEYESGEVVLGEHDIDESIKIAHDSRIVNLSLEPRATLSKTAYQVLQEADLVVLGPGDLYTSILANCVVDGFAEALAESRAKVVYVCNLMSKKGQTVGLNAREHVAEISKYIGRCPDMVVVNTSTFPPELLNNYANKGDKPVLNNLKTNEDYEVCAESLVADDIFQPQKEDVVNRSLIRHNPDKLASIIFRMLQDDNQK